MLKKIKKKLDEEREKRNWGKGTIVLNSSEELDEIFDKFKSHLVSPGGAAGLLGVSRAYINYLEKEGKIRAYRIWHEDIHWDDLPLRWKPFMAVKDVYIYIPVEDIERIKAELIEKTEKKLKALKKKS